MPLHLLDSLYDKMLSRLGLALLALALLINLGALIAIDKSIGALDESRKQAIKSQNVLVELASVQSLLFEAESGQWGFLSSGKAAYLNALRANEPKIVARLSGLRNLVAGSPTQLELIEQLRKIADEKLAEMNKTVAVKQLGQEAEVLALLMTDQGKKLMDAFGAGVAQGTRQQEQQRIGQVAKGDDIQQAIHWGYITILFINATLILAGAVTIMRDFSQKRAELQRLDKRATVLASEVAQRAGELRALSAYLLQVQEKERHTIARELHDELGGTLSAVKMDILMGRDAASKRGDEKTVARMQRALVSIDSGVQFTRRLIEDLRPTLLDNLGLEAALRSMTEQFSERCNVQCEISLPENELNLSSEQSTVVYRVCQEALTNVMKYAQAKLVTINLSCDDSGWTLMLADDGVGLDTTKRNRSISHGLLGMRERIVALGGMFDIQGPAGRGTTLIATFPVIVQKETAPA